MSDRPADETKPVKRKEPLVFRACLAKRQGALVINGEGDRALLTLEALGVDAARAMGAMVYAGDDFNVMIFPITYQPILTELDDDQIHEAPKRAALRVGRRGLTV